MPASDSRPPARACTRRPDAAHFVAAPDDLPLAAAIIRPPVSTTRREADVIMRRRTFLTTGSMAAVGFGITACGPKTAPNVTPRHAPLALPLVKASWDRIIRTTVGLRPHRDAGFVLKADKLDD